MERRNFLLRLLGLFGVINFAFSRCEKGDNKKVFLDQWSMPEAGLDSGQEKDLTVDTSSIIVSKISILEDLKRRLGDLATIEITHDEDGDPYVFSISDLGTDCLYFEVNGNPLLGEGVHVQSVFIDPKEDNVIWYCQGQPFSI